MARKRRVVVRFAPGPSWAPGRSEDNDVFVLEDARDWLLYVGG